MATTTETGTKQAREEDNKSEKNTAKSQEKGGNVKSGSSENSSAGSGSIEKITAGAQSFIGDKAGQISTLAQQTFEKASETASNLGSRATEVITQSADYVKNIDVEKARETVKTSVKKNPELSIAIAGVTGLIIGLLIGRNRR